VRDRVAFGSPRLGDCPGDAGDRFCCLKKSLSPRLGESGGSATRTFSSAVFGERYNSAEAIVRAGARDVLHRSTSERSGYRTVLP
jgi:hypothetical protein